jgi:predicted nucleic acid-binding protein
LILFECGNAAARRPYRSAPYRLWIELEIAGLLIQPTTEDVRQSWSDYQRGSSGTAGAVDHVSFVVMRRLRLTQAFTNDRHFRAAGFEPLF